MAVISVILRKNEVKLLINQSLSKLFTCQKSCHPFYHEPEKSLMK